MNRLSTAGFVPPSVPGHALYEKGLQRQKGVVPLVGSQEQRAVLSENLLGAASAACGHRCPPARVPPKRNSNRTNSASCKDSEEVLHSEKCRSMRRLLRRSECRMAGPKRTSTVRLAQEISVPRAYQGTEDNCSERLFGRMNSLTRIQNRRRNKTRGCFSSR